jgi:hypothetical protein
MYSLLGSAVGFGARETLIIFSNLLPFSRLPPLGPQGGRGIPRAPSSLFGTGSLELRLYPSSWHGGPGERTRDPPPPPPPQAYLTPRSCNRCHV